MYSCDDYLVLKGVTRKELVGKVREWIEKDFVPQGGVVVTFDKDGIETGFFQAIAKTVKK